MPKPLPIPAALALLVTLLAAGPTAASMADQRLGGCPERVILRSDGERMVAAVLSLVPGQVTLTGNDDHAALLRECARTVRAKVCTDGLLFTMLDPVGSTVGGVAGLAVDGARGGPSLLGGLLGAGVGGTVAGVVGLGRCQQRLEEELAPAAAAAFTGWRVDPSSVRPDAVTGRVISALETRAISGEAAQSLKGYLDGVAARLARP